MDPSQHFENRSSFDTTDLENIDHVPRITDPTNKSALYKKRKSDGYVDYITKANNSRIKSLKNYRKSEEDA